MPTHELIQYIQKPERGLDIITEPENELLYAWALNLSTHRVELIAFPKKKEPQ